MSECKTRDAKLPQVCGKLLQLWWEGQSYSKCAQQLKQYLQEILNRIRNRVQRNNNYDNQNGNNSYNAEHNVGGNNNYNANNAGYNAGGDHGAGNATGNGTGFNEAGQSMNAQSAEIGFNANKIEITEEEIQERLRKMSSPFFEMAEPKCDTPRGFIENNTRLYDKMSIKISKRGISLLMQSLKIDNRI